MALGDYVKTTWVNGGPPGISAGRLNNIENKTEELDTAVKTHLADEMPHQFTSTNKTYRYGFKAQDNHLIFTYEEVV